MENNAKFYEQEKATINGRLIAHYLCSTPIGDIHIVQYENQSLEVIDEYLGFSNQKAEKSFNKICKKIIDNKI